MVQSYYQYIVRREDSFPISRDEIVRLLTEDGIGSRPSYPMPLYQQKALRDLRIRGRCPVAEDVVPRLFELPVHPGVGPAEIERILSAVERIARPAYAKRHREKSAGPHGHAYGGRPRGLCKTASRTPAGRGLPPRRPRPLPSEGRPRLPPRPRLGVPEPRDPLR